MTPDDSSETTDSAPLVTAADVRAAADRLDVGEALLTFLVETSGRGHAGAIRQAIADREYAVQRVN